MFIAVDGVDGAGKTTLVNQLSIFLKHIDQQREPIITKEPTNLTKWGKRLRESAKSGRYSKDKEIEYFHLDRVFHVERIIKPAIMDKKIVITDRYVDSTLAFQCGSPEEADILYQSFLPEILVPDITFILKCPVEIGLDRIKRNRGSTTKFENIETLDRARKIYESRSGINYIFLDASGSVSETFDQAIRGAAQKLKELGQAASGELDASESRTWESREATADPQFPKAAAGS